jgi:hypothetical protein
MTDPIPAETLTEWLQAVHDDPANARAMQKVAIEAVPPLVREVERLRAALAEYDDRLITCPECRSTFEAEDHTVVEPWHRFRYEAARIVRDLIGDRDV